MIARAAGDLLGGVELEEDLDNYNVAPTQTVPVLVDHEDDGAWHRELHAARWGLLPRWAKDESFSSRAFNARSETVLEKPTFRHAVKAQHCAVPATGYYEWLKHPSPEKGRPAKTPFYVHPEDEAQNIYFAGLYEWWKVPDGPEAGGWLLSTTILTMDSPGEREAELAEEGAATLSELSRLHDRLPIPLAFTGADDDALTRWLRATDRPDAAVERVREGAYDVAATWRLREVGSEVGNVSNNGPGLIEPAGTLL
ncbi:SOS response-associated peptidase [Rothia santali]|uniref:SOS response-associated peptidase n=1 Tax=Rothia santali TaxID=2949643 RepID=UPI002815F924|nr:SOS response-associated peptidase [Rothia santali]